MNKLIFREYDIRGVADLDLTNDVVTLIGKAYGTYLKRKGKKVITLGRDCRTSSERIYDAFVTGVLSTGIDIVSIGLSTTPCLYFSVIHFKVDGGAMITGSHNPPEHNGLKLSMDTSNLHGAQIQELKQLIERSDFEKGSGKVSKREVLVDYQNHIFRLFKFKRRLKVGVDCGNGMTSLVAPDLIMRFGHQVTKLYTELDGRFPNHPPDPSEPENLRDLIKTIRQKKLDVGLAFDGDGDRVGVVDHEGNVIAGDKLLVLHSRSILKEVPGAIIIGDVKCSSVFFDDIKKHGGKPIMWKTGHSLIKAKMKEEGAILAGEMSGHIFFKHRWFGFDSGVYAACRTLEILDRSGKTIPQLLSDLPKTYSTPEMRVNCPDEVKFSVVKAVLDDFKKEYKVVDIDGVRVEFPDGWGLVRASNTQPVLVTRFEATSEKRLAEIRKLVEDKISEFLARAR